MIRKILVILFSCITLFPYYGNVKPPIPVGNETADRKFVNVLPENPEKKNTTPNFPTLWGGSSLTQEDKTISGLKVTAFLLDGGAWIQHKKVKLSANQIEIYGKDAFKGFLRGGVFIQDGDNGVTLRAGVGEYDKFEEKVIIKVRPRLFHTDKSGVKTVISATFIERNLANKTTLLKENVIIAHPQITILCKEAVFEEDADKITTDPDPILIAKDRYLTGKQLTFYTNANKVELNGESILFQNYTEKEAVENKDKKDSAEEKIKKEVTRVSIFKGDRLVSDKDENGETRIGLYGNATIYRRNLKMNAEKLTSYGKNSSKIEARNQITVHDRENALILSGNILDYFKNDQYIHLTDSGKIDFLDKKTEAVTSTMTAVEFERFMDKNETVIRGNVLIEGKDSSATGEYATYYEKEEKLYLEGNPTLKKNGRDIHAGKIIFFPREGRALLTDGIDPGK
ncbi:LptA/OstA family protein [Leptospira alstonii]|uniref:OstA-like protein n=2 Tax=Leptospira alstonii TaxID=28452 RepID=M6CV95_9LEPT|nr:LptA/OstA family protein [Leptospira alstonii]EMJ95639.1 OstA-like protein [Leptospira alstonii serovar Sichuan str. 79601]EQA81469.1 lipopolysaccharide transport system LptA/LptD domain protein [Leptospira alstonii serovar Pingchang str. 80-412]